VGQQVVGEFRQKRLVADTCRASRPAERDEQCACRRIVGGLAEKRCRFAGAVEQRAEAVGGLRCPDPRAVKHPVEPDAETVEARDGGVEAGPTLRRQGTLGVGARRPPVLALDRDGVTNQEEVHARIFARNARAVYETKRDCRLHAAGPKRYKPRPDPASNAWAHGPLEGPRASPAPGIPMSLLLLSLAGLAAGPVMLTLLHPASRGRAALDVFVLVGICGLVLLHVVPDAIEAAGWPAGAAAVLGLALPHVVHRILPHGLGRAGAGVALLGLLALGTHAMLDGVALGAAENQLALAAAVVLHRLPLGLSVWWLGQTLIGRRAALAILAIEAGGTIAGFLLGGAAADLLSVRALPILQALLAGSVLHVLFGHGPHAQPAEQCRDTPDGHVHGQPSWRLHRAAAVFGGTLALAALVGLSQLE
jgi:hypothetical protein